MPKLRRVVARKVAVRRSKGVHVIIVRFFCPSPRMSDVFFHAGARKIALARGKDRACMEVRKCVRWRW